MFYFRFVIVVILVVVAPSSSSSSSSSSSPSNTIEVRLLRSVGGSVDIPCYHDATEESTQPRWYKEPADGGRVEEAVEGLGKRRKQTSEGDVLMMDGLEFEDAGKYTCKFGRPEMITITYLTLMRPIRCPKIEEPPEIRGGDRLSLRCTIETLGQDRPNLVWRLGNKEVANPAKQRREETVSGCFYTIQDLKLRPDYEDDGKRLECKAEFQGWNPDEASLSCGRDFHIFNKPGFARNISCPASVSLDLTNAIEEKPKIACNVSSEATKFWNESNIKWEIGRDGRVRTQPEDLIGETEGGKIIRCPISLSDLKQTLTPVTLTIGAINGEEIYKVIQVDFNKGIFMDDKAFGNMYYEILKLREVVDKLVEDRK